MPFAFSALYLLLAACYLAADHVLTLPAGSPLSALLKILPLLLLLSRVLWLRPAGQLSALVAALLCSMLGDVLLAWDGNRLFVYGLAAFLLAHLCYLQALRPFDRFAGWLLVPYAAFAAGVLSLLWPNLGALALPVLGYIGVILAMSFATWCSQGRNRWLTLGGVLFISSDALLGLNKFWQPLPQAGLLIMLTYYGAQYALVRGFLPSTALRVS